MNLGMALLLISPVIVIEIGLMVFSLIDLFRPERRVKGGSKVVWALVILVFNLIGSVVYLLAGREED